MKSFKIIFGETLKEQRTLLTLSQRVVSERSGLTIQAIRHMERGRRGPTFATAIKAIVYGLGMTLDNFLLILEEKGIGINPKDFLDMLLKELECPEIEAQKEKDEISKKMKDYPCANTAFGNVLRKHRKQKRPKVTQARLAELVDGSEIAVRLIELGMQEPKYITILLLTEALEIPVDTFMKDIREELTKLQESNLPEDTP